MKIQKIKPYLHIDYLSEVLLLLFKRHIKKISIAIVFIFVCVFFLILFANKRQAKLDNITSQYIVAQGKVVQQEHDEALKMFQNVYNNSHGMLEVMAFINILDIIQNDQQYTALKTLLLDIPTLKQSSELFIILYSKALNVVLALESKNSISKEEKNNLFSIFSKHLQNITVSQGLRSHKHALLFAFGNPFIDDLSTLPENEMTDILETIQKNTK